MARYIDADTFLESIKRNTPYIYTMVGLIVEMEPKLNIIHCKDCKYGELDDPALPNQRFCRHNGCDWNNENHFCSYGERK